MNKFSTLFKFAQSTFEFGFSSLKKLNKIQTMATVKGRLVEIPKEDLSMLKDLHAAKSGSRTSVAFSTIDTYIRWIEKDPNQRKYVKFYCLNGDFSDGTFIVIERIRAYADTLNDSFENLQRLLQLLDYSMGYIFLSIRSELRQTFKDALEKANVKIAHEYVNLLYHLPKEIAITFNAERDGVSLRPITELHDIEKINSMWSLRGDNTLVYLRRLAKFNLTVGAFNKDGTLMAWIFRFEDGLVGVLQTDENHLKHGYGSLVSQAIARKVADMGQDVYCAIHEDNKASRSIYDKFGSFPLGYVYCIVTENAISAGVQYVNT